jgi:UDP-N-acetylglucosamine--N-acetylmuramyl-(pentapeptide) pyrophosphoryl-undecaprenol N-acetylglucosamine transferase
MKILFAGGGTGGHIFPILAVARELKKVREELFSQEKLEFFYFGPKDTFDQAVLSDEDIKIRPILAGKIRRYFTALSLIQNIFDIIFKIPLGTLQAFWNIFLLSPDVIFSKGGYGSWPVVFAGWLFGVPIFLHESDVTPGLANKIMSRFALIVFVSFPKTEYFPPAKTILSGNPIRKELLEGLRQEAWLRFQLSREKPTILILGGSQGAQRINDLILEILPEIIEKYEIIHQCGEKNFHQVGAEANAVISEEQLKYYHLFPFLDEIELSHAYQGADLVVSRAGSSIIFEIAAIGKPSILIPIPESAQNHQSKNAYAFAQEERTVVIEEENLTPHFFLNRVHYLFSHPREMAEMAKRAKEFAQPQAAQVIAQYLMDYLFS